MARFKTHLVAVSYPVDDPDEAAGFYAALLGVRLPRALTEDRRSRQSKIAKGVQLTLHPRQDPEETPIAHFSVSNLDEAIQELEAQGGQRVADFDMPLTGRARQIAERQFRKHGVDDPIENRMGRAAIVRDPAGNQIGLVQLERFARRSLRGSDLDQRDADDQEDDAEASEELDQ